MEPSVQQQEMANLLQIQFSQLDVRLLLDLVRGVLTDKELKKVDSFVIRAVFGSISVEEAKWSIAGIIANHLSGIDDE